MSTIEVCQDLKVVKNSIDLKQVKETLGQRIDNMNPVCDAFNTCCQEINRKIILCGTILQVPVAPCWIETMSAFLAY